LLHGPIVVQTLTEEVYRRLRLSLFENVYQPGEQLDVGQIAAYLNVSRQPVKEALTRLSQEGLVEIKQRVGTFVRKFSGKDVHNIMEARRMIEIFALTNATVDKATLQVLNNEINHMDQINESSPIGYLSYNDSDHKFHKLLVGLSGNQILLTMYAQLNAHYIAARAFYTKASERTVTGYSREYYKAQHRLIFQHLQRGEMDQATAALDAHIKESENELLTIFND
jgi:DNA-binding GntR family transcriptional regulator